VRYDDLLEKNPEKAVEKAIKGMIPKNSLGRQMLSKLKVYSGDQHPHAAQRPVPFEITQVAQ
jgi:large subunit ribosomal protein L13